VVPPEEYVALLPDRVPAYLSKERFEAVQRRLTENRARAESKGAPREGESLLGGLVVCAHCGRRMAIHYSGERRHLRYACTSGRRNGTGPGCQALAGGVLDQFVAQQVLAALQPGALELSLAAAEDVLRERARLDEHWRQRLERARYQAGRVERQYRAADPENRLVVRTLERQWEQALQEVRQVEEEYDRFRRQQPAAVGEHEVAQIRALAADLPALWQAATTTAADRQQVVRFLVERVVVAARRETDQVQVSVTWVGGVTSRHTLTRPVLSYRQMPRHGELLARIRELRDGGLSFARIADAVNAEGFRPSKQALRFTGDTVGLLWRRHVAPTPPRRRQDPSGLLRRDEWTVSALATELRVPKNTLLAWLRRGWVRYRRLPGYRGRCLCWADAAELARLRRLREAPHGWWDPPLPAELTTPALGPPG
jgi:hypothetical protein